MNDEQSIIARAQRGDARAYELLVREYEQIAFRVAFLITHDPAEAADAAQDAFLRAYHALGSFRLHKPFRPWLLRIVTNLALNRIQAAQRRMKMTERFSQALLIQPADPTPDRVVAEREQSERLLQAVQRLSAEEQWLIALRYFMELPEYQVAQSLNVPLGTVKSRLHRTLARLREIIERDFPDLRELILPTG